MKQRSSLRKKARRLAGIGLAIGSLLLPERALAQAENQSSPYRAQVVLDANSEYVLRAIPISNEPVLQPLLAVNRGSLTGLIFGVIDPNNQNANEIDLSLDCTRQLSERINLSAGYTYIDFHDIKERTQEIYAGISLSTMLNPSIFLYRDFDLVNGTYGEASVSKVLRRLETRLSLGYNDRYFRENTGISHLNASISLPLQISKRTGVAGKLSFIRALNREFKNHFTYGIGVNRSL